MGLFNFMRKENEVKDENVVIVDVNNLRNTLKEINPFLTEEQVNEAVEIIKTQINDFIEDIKEKSEMSFSDLPFILSHSISNYLVKPHEDRLKICKEIDTLISNFPETAQAIRLYASTIAYGSPEFKLDEYKWILTKKNNKVSDDELEGAKKFLYNFDRISGIKRLIYIISKDLVAYGDAFIEKIRGENNKIISFAYIPSNTVYIETDDYGNPTHFYQIKDLSINYKDIIFNKKYDKKIIKFEKNEILHFNDGSFVGMSDNIFRSLIPIWRAYQLLEQSLVIHRVTRSRRYVVFFVDVSGKERKEIRDSIRSFINKLRNFFNFDLEKGIEYSYKSSIKTGEDLVIPITRESKTKMQIVPPDTGAHKVDDLNFFHKRLLNLLFVEHIFGDKKSKSPDVDKAFNRLIRVYQRQIAWTLEDLYREVLEENGFENIDVSIIFPTPDSEEEIKIVDTLVRRLLLINQLTTVLGKSLPFNWVIEYVFKDLTIAQLEELKELLIKNEEQPSEEKEYVENLLSYEPATLQKENLLNVLGEPEKIEIENKHSIKDIFEKTVSNSNDNNNIIRLLDLSLEYLKLKNRI